MSSKPHTDDVYRPKRIPKNPIKFKIQLNDEQKQAKAEILENTITLLAGQAGSGKTLLACNVALDGLFRRMYDKVIITRPTVSKEEIGLFPGRNLVNSRNDYGKITAFFYNPHCCLELWLLRLFFF